jgi:pyruvate ferredoxin oxidoreductase alpha subunit
MAVESPWEGPHFLDLNDRVVGREIHRVRKVRRSGSTAENILRQLALASHLPPG